MSLSRPLAAFVAATALAAALTGCGSSDAATVDQSAGSAAASSEGGPANVASAEALAVIDKAEAAALEAGAVTISIRSTVDGAKSTGTGAVRLGEDPAATLTTAVSFQGRKGEVTFVATKEGAFLEVGDLAGRGKEVWVRLDASAARFAASLGPVAETFLTAADFTDLAKVMRASEVTIAGQDTVDGPNGAATLDLLGVVTPIDNAIALADPLLAEGLGALKSVGTDTVTSEVGIVTKVEGEVAEGVEGLPASYNVTLSGGRSILEYRDWGQPVSIQAPAPDQVVAFADAFGA